MKRREFVKLTTGKRVWHALSSGSNYLLCQESVNIEWNGRVKAVTVRQEHKLPRPMCKTCAKRITPEYTQQWVDAVRMYERIGN